MGTPESKAYWHTVAKDTLYDYHPKLDADVITTNRNIADAEDKLGVTMSEEWKVSNLLINTQELEYVRNTLYERN